MQKEQAVAVIPQQEQLRNETVLVDNEWIYPFLVGSPKYFPFKYWEFSDTLTLSYLKPFVELLASAKKEVLVFPPEQKAQVIQELQDFHDPEQLSALYDQLANAEGNMTIVYNNLNNQLAYTPIEHGDYATSRTNMFEYMSEAIWPLVEVHTHPKNALFSHIDYTRLLAKGYANGRRVVNGVMVLNPSFQLLALPRPKTPLFELLDVPLFIASKEAAYHEQMERLRDSKNKRLEKISRGVNNRLTILEHEATVLEQEEIVRREFDGALSQQEGSELREQLFSLYNSEVTNYQQIRRYLRYLTNQSFIRKQNIFDNLDLLTFAREVDVEQFISFDREHFRKWSA